jgi:hypothetical protein
MASTSCRAGDPYFTEICCLVLPLQLAAGQILGHELRQELFSFAAAGVIDMGVPERLAILNRSGRSRGVCCCLGNGLPKTPVCIADGLDC